MAEKKRRLSDEDGNEEKQRKIQRYESEFNLVEFSDEILLKIFHNLDSISVWNVAKTCPRLRRVARDKTIWHDVDLTAKPLSGSQISGIVFKDVCCYPEIRSLRLRGLVSMNPQDQWKNQTVCNKFLQRLGENCPHLKTISIVEGCFDVSRVIMVCFPKTLTVFEVDKCALINCTSTKNLRRRETSFFSGINTHMTALERLAVENCTWFDTHDLIALSKLPSLKNLSLRGCNNLRECVPYGSIATRFGFKALEVLDVRNTPVTDSDIQCFNLTENLKEIRLQCPVVGEKSEEQQPEEKVVSDEPGPSGEPQMERQTINVHFRRVENNNEPEAVPVAAAENDENGAEFQAGNNVRINIRNQNVQGRNVIHILVRNNHSCNRDEQPGPSGDQPQEPPPPAPAQNEPNNAAEEPAGQEPQHFIMIRGFQNAQEEPDDVQNNPARLVQPPFVTSNPFEFYNRFIQFERTFPMNARVQPETLITDRGICSFGYSGNRDGVVWIRREPENRKVNTSLERITVRDYKLVTDNSLIHLSTCAPNIKFLDVVGTEITKDGIEKFKLIKPDCIVVSDFGSFD